MPQGDPYRYADEKRTDVEKKLGGRFDKATGKYKSTRSRPDAGEQRGHAKYPEPAKEDNDLERLRIWAENMTRWAMAVREDLVQCCDDDPGDPPPLPWG